MRWRRARARLVSWSSPACRSRICTCCAVIVPSAEKRRSASCARPTGHAQVDQRAAAARARRAVVDGHDGAAERVHGVEHALRRARELGDAADGEPQRGGVVLCPLPVGQRRGRRATSLRAEGAGASALLPVATPAWSSHGASSCTACAASGDGVGRASSASASRPRRRSLRRPRPGRAPARGAGAGRAGSAGAADGAAPRAPPRARPRASARARAARRAARSRPCVSSSMSAPMRRSRPSSPASPRSSASRRSGAIGSDVLMGLNLRCQPRERAGEPRRTRRRA